MRADARAGQAAVTQDGDDGRKIQGQRGDLPDGQRLKIGQMREQRRRREEKGRIMPAVDVAVLAEFRALFADVARHIERFLGMAAQRFQPRDPDLRKIRAELTPGRVEPAVRGRDHGRHGEYGEAEKH